VTTIAQYRPAPMAEAARAPSAAVETIRAPSAAVEMPAAHSEVRSNRSAMALGAVTLVLVLAAAGAGYAWFSERLDKPMTGRATPAAEIAAPAPTNAMRQPEPPAAMQQAPPPDAPAPLDRPAVPDATPPPVAAATTQRVAPPATAEPPARSTSTTPPRATAIAAVRPLSAPQRIPSTKLPNARCADIIQHAALGEELSDADKTLLKQECRP
jgi:type IV secretory pathway VirB10-like protein